jgi:hypothetical protein
MLKLGDHELQMRDHCLCTDRSGLSIPTRRSLNDEFSTQRVDVIGNRIVRSHRNNEGITIALSRAPEILPVLVISLSSHPAISGRQVLCGCLQSIPSTYSRAVRLRWEQHRPPAMAR